MFCQTTKPFHHVVFFHLISPFAVAFQIDSCLFNRKRNSTNSVVIKYPSFQRDFSHHVEERFKLVKKELVKKPEFADVVQKLKEFSFFQ